MTSIPANVPTDLIPCECGHMRDEHTSDFFAECHYGDCDDYAPDLEFALAYAASAGSEYQSRRYPIALALELIGTPATAWPGNCHAIATALFRGAQVAGCPTGGRVVYGHYRGFIHPQGHFANRALVGFTHHGWIDLGDGQVLDPTRWVFENVDPYVYEGPADDYDEGGNVLREQMATPCPQADEDADCVLVLEEGDADELTRLSGGVLTQFAHAPGQVQTTFAQRMWLANLPLTLLGEHARAFYTALREAGAGALLPYDNRVKVLA